MARPSVKEMRRRELMEAAITCVAKKGLQRTTITDVSDAAGLSRGIINFYFSTKEAMLESALTSLLEGFLARALKETTRCTPEQAPQAFLIAHLTPDICNQKRMNVWLEFCGAATSHREYRESFEEYAQRWHQAYAQLVKDAGGKPNARQSQQHFITLTGAWVQVGLGNLAEMRKLADGLLSAPVAAAVPVKAQKPAKQARKAKASAKKEKPAKAAPKAKSKAEQLDFIDLFAIKA